MEESVCPNIDCLNSIDSKMDELMDEVKKLNVITILNGDDGKTPITMKREDFFQTVYDRTSAKHKFNSVSAFSSKIMPIIALITVIISIWLSMTALRTERTVLDNSEQLKKELLQNKEK